MTHTRVVKEQLGIRHLLPRGGVAGHAASEIEHRELRGDSTPTATQKGKRSETKWEGRTLVFRRPPTQLQDEV